MVTKGLLGSIIYAVPVTAWPGTAATPGVVNATLQRVGDVALSLVTDGSVLPDGRVLLRTYSTLAVLPALAVTPRASGGRVSPLATLSLPDQRQGEGLAVVDAKAGVIALSSEGAGQPVLRMTPSTSFWRAGAPPATSGGSGSGGSGSGGSGSGASAAPGPGAGTSAAGDPGSGDGQAPGWLPLIGVGAVLLVLVAIARQVRGR